MAKKTPTPKQAYIAIDIDQEQVIATGTLDYLVNEIEEYIDMENYDENDVEYIKVFELGNEKMVLAHTRFDITIG